MGDNPDRWQTIPGFPSYHINDEGLIYNVRTHAFMSISRNNHGHMKITLTDRWGERFTRSVAQLVAQAFVEAPNSLCDALIMLDGDFTNVDATNLAWRPKWFAWKYTRQLKVPPPRYYTNLAVLDITTNYSYENIVSAGVTNGLLFEDIWRSTNTGKQTFPTGSIFEVL